MNLPVISEGARISSLHIFVSGDEAEVFKVLEDGFLVNIHRVIDRGTKTEHRIAFRREISFDELSHYARINPDVCIKKDSLLMRGNGYFYPIEKLEGV